jgi:predicted nucleotidyltransferase
VAPTLDLPDHLGPAEAASLRALLAANLERHGDGLLGLVLTGSAGRGRATDRSDLDVFVVLTDDAARDRSTSRSTELDEIPVSLSELEQLSPFGTEDWWGRWAFAWAPVLLDRTGGRVAAAALRQARVDDAEARAVLVEHDRLDGWLNFAYRALKSARVGRHRECRLDAAESVPWLLDVVFTLAGRVRPYNSYLVWELGEHPLPGWPDGRLLDLVERTLDGDAAAVRETFAVLEPRLRRDSELAAVADGWGAELEVLRGTGADDVHPGTTPAAARPTVGP